MATGDRMGYNQQCDMLVLRSWSCPSKWTDFCTEPFLIWETKMVQPQRWGFWPANLGICGVKWCQMWKLKVANKCVWTCFEFDILVFLWWHCVPLGSLMTGSGHHGHHTCGTLWPSKAKSLGHVAPQAVGMKWCSSALRLSGFMVGSSTHGVKPWGQPGQPIWVCLKLGYISNLLVLLPTMFSASSHHPFWFLDRKCSSLADFPAVFGCLFPSPEMEKLGQTCSLGAQRCPTGPPHLPFRI